LGADGTTRLPGGWFGDRDDVDGAFMKIYKFEGYIAVRDSVDTAEVRAAFDKMIHDSDDMMTETVDGCVLQGKITGVRGTAIKDVDPFVVLNPSADARAVHQAAWDKWYDEGDKVVNLLTRWLGEVEEVEDDETV
jgi:hypothetical protein